MGKKPYVPESGKAGDQARCSAAAWCVARLPTDKEPCVGGRSGFDGKGLVKEEVSLLECAKVSEA